MKEFKMKAWLKEEKKMVNIIGIDFNYEYIRYTEDDNLFNSDYKIANFKDIELLQYIAVKDKEGIEIYEGDIVRAPDVDDARKFFNGVIEYSEKYAGFIINFGGLEEDFYWCNQSTRIKVIGNIHKNPELLGNKYGKDL